jgi:hypothetical protein
LTGKGVAVTSKRRSWKMKVIDLDDDALTAAIDVVVKIGTIAFELDDNRMYSAILTLSDRDPAEIEVSELITWATQALRVADAVMADAVMQERGRGLLPK